jgi:cytochrome c553
MKYLMAIFILTCLPWPSIAVRAQADAAAQYQPCIACHGATGQGNTALGAPALAGQGAAYLERQLKHFKAGIRGADPRDTQGAQMKAMASALDDAAIALIASYLGALPRPVPVTAQAGDLKNGNNNYQAKCGACHGGAAEGNPGLNAPGLAWLDAPYLKHQYHNFQQGVRGTHTEDKFGRQMKMMATSLPTDKDLDDVIAYMQSLAKAP